MAQKRSFSEATTATPTSKSSIWHLQTRNILFPVSPTYNLRKRLDDPVIVKNYVEQLHHLWRIERLCPQERTFRLSCAQVEKLFDDLEEDPVRGVFVRKVLKISYFHRTNEVTIMTNGTSTPHEGMTSMFAKSFYETQLWIEANGSESAKAYMKNVCPLGQHRAKVESENSDGETSGDGNEDGGGSKKSVDASYFGNDLSWQLTCYKPPPWHPLAFDLAAWEKEREYPAFASPLVETVWSQKQSSLDKKIKNLFECADGGVRLLMALILPYKPPHKKIELQIYRPLCAPEAYESSDGKTKYLYEVERLCIRDEDGVRNPEMSNCSWTLADFSLPFHHKLYDLSDSDLNIKFTIDFEAVVDLFDMLLSTWYDQKKRGSFRPGHKHEHGSCPFVPRETPEAEWVERCDLRRSKRLKIETAQDEPKKSEGKQSRKRSEGKEAKSGGNKPKKGKPKKPGTRAKGPRIVKKKVVEVKRKGARKEG